MGREFSELPTFIFLLAFVSAFIFAPLTRSFQRYFFLLFIYELLFYLYTKGKHPFWRTEEQILLVLISLEGYILGTLFKKDNPFFGQGKIFGSVEELFKIEPSLSEKK